MKTPLNTQRRPCAHSNYIKLRKKPNLSFEMGFPELCSRDPCSPSNTQLEKATSDLTQCCQYSHLGWRLDLRFPIRNYFQYEQYKFFLKLLLYKGDPSEVPCTHLGNQSFYSEFQKHSKGFFFLMHKNCIKKCTACRFRWKTDVSKNKGFFYIDVLSLGAGCGACWALSGSQ